MMIARRSLKLRQGQTDVEVTVRPYQPEPDGSVWMARFEIEWPEGLRKAAAKGVDPVQSLVLAPQMIGGEIHTSEYHKAGALSWREPGQGYGFPVPQNLRDLLVGDDAKFL